MLNCYLCSCRRLRISSSGRRRRSGPVPRWRVGIVWCVLMLVVEARAIAVEPQYLIGIAVGLEQTVYLADRKWPGIFVQREGKLEPYYVGSKKIGSPLNAVRCLAIDREGKLLAGDSATREVYRFDENAQPVPLTKGGIGIPMSIGVNKAGDLLVADLELHRLWKVPSAGGKPELFAEIPAPRGLFIDADDRVWVVSHGKDQLLRLTADGKERQIVVPGRPFEFPSAVVVDDAGTAFVCDTYAKAVWRVEAEKKPENLPSATALITPVAIAWQKPSILLIVDSRQKEIIKLNVAE